VKSLTNPAIVKLAHVSAQVKSITSSAHDPYLYNDCAQACEIGNERVFYSTWFGVVSYMQTGQFLRVVRIGDKRKTRPRAACFQEESRGDYVRLTVIIVLWL